MVKRLTTILLLLALGAGVASGAPLHAGAEECDMGGAMEMMDCCKRARSVGNTPEIQAARLCCAVNCQQGGANGPSSAVRVSAPQVAAQHPAATSSPMPAPLAPPRAWRDPGLSSADESPPLYLINLAFLI
ncbi:MAG TPA: hypothetical protein VD968_13590 [Pyrinomonadaceae bacterium]|nr:hypothetical protein [Pyrinomonadaceae bacterium]